MPLASLLIHSGPRLPWYLTLPEPGPTVDTTANAPLGLAGWAYAGLEGLIWAVALIDIPAAYAYWAPLMKMGLFNPVKEARSFGLLLIGAAIGHSLSWVIPG